MTRLLAASRRHLVMIAAIALASIALAACNGGSDTPTPSPEPTVATRTPEPTVATRTPEPTAATRTPEPTVATPTPEPTVATRTPEPTLPTRTPEPTVRADRTGIAYVDAVLDAVESGNPADLVSLLHYAELPCAAMPGLGGPPRCDSDETPGDVVTVMPVGSCEGFFERPPTVEAERVRAWTAPGAYTLVAVYRVRGAGDPNYPSGDYGIIYASTAGGNEVGAALYVGRQGIVRFFDGCSETAAMLVERVKDDLVLGPLQ